MDWREFPAKGRMGQIQAARIEYEKDQLKERGMEQWAQHAPKVQSFINKNRFRGAHKINKKSKFETIKGNHSS